MEFDVGLEKLWEIGYRLSVIESHGIYCKVLDFTVSQFLPSRPCINSYIV